MLVYVALAAWASLRLMVPRQLNISRGDVDGVTRILDCCSLARFHLVLQVNLVVGLSTLDSAELPSGAAE